MLIAHIVRKQKEQDDLQKKERRKTVSVARVEFNRKRVRVEVDQKLDQAGKSRYYTLLKEHFMKPVVADVVSVEDWEFYFPQVFRNRKPVRRSFDPKSEGSHWFYWSNKALPQGLSCTHIEDTALPRRYEKRDIDTFWEFLTDRFEKTRFRKTLGLAAFVVRFDPTSRSLITRTRTLKRLRYGSQQLARVFHWGHSTGWITLAYSVSFATEATGVPSSYVLPLVYEYLAPGFGPNSYLDEAIFRNKSKRKAVQRGLDRWLSGEGLPGGHSMTPGSRRVFGTIRRGEHEIVPESAIRATDPSRACTASVLGVLPRAGDIEKEYPGLKTCRVMAETLRCSDLGLHRHPNLDRDGSPDVRINLFSLD